MYQTKRSMDRRWLLSLSLSLSLLLSLWLSSTSALYAAPATQNIPQTLNYQGILRDAQGDVVNGTRNMTVRIYDAAIGGTALHEETIGDVQVRDGIFNVVLGDVATLGNNVFANGPRFIGITIAPDSRELVPRQRLHPVPWAQQAG